MWDARVAWVADGAVLARWRALVDTAGEEERAGRDHAERSLHISPTFEGAWRTKRRWNSAA